MNEAKPNALEAAPCGLFIAEENGTLIEVNQYLADWIGREASALHGTHLDRIFSKPSRTLFHTYVMPMLKSHGEAAEVELTLAGAGRTVEVLLSARRQPSPDGLSYTHGVLYPLRARRRLEEQLLNAQRVIEHVPGMMFQLLLRPDGSSAIPYSNAGIRALHGLTPESVRESAELYWASIHPDDLAALRAGFDTAVRDLDRWHGQFRTRPRGHTLWIDIHVSPQLLPDGSVVLHSYSFDASARAHAQQAVLAKEVAERASEAKTRFLARVSHELRNPLACIVGFSDLLRAGATGLSESARQMLQHMETATHQVLDLVDELLDISSIESGASKLSLQDVKLATALQSTLLLMAPMASAAGVKFELDVPHSLAVRADARRLGQVLTNLVSNGIKYNRVDGHLFVTARPANGRVRLSVRDEGKGMTREQLRSLFQPFNRLGAAESIRGTGLGLVITRALVEQMDGTIHVSSTPAIGSEFSVSLPSAHVKVPLERAGP